MRAFAALPLPSDIRARIAEIQESLQFVLLGESIRWTSAEQWHLTLHFLGEIKPDSEPALIKTFSEICQQHSRPRLHLTGLGTFPSLRSPKVLWLGIGASTELVKLQKEVSQAIAEFGSSNEVRTYHPHITLARLRKPDHQTIKEVKRHVSGGIFPDGPEWEAESACLYRSILSPSGSRYSLISECPLSG